MSDNQTFDSLSDTFDIAFSEKPKPVEYENAISKIEEKANIAKSNLKQSLENFIDVNEIEYIETELKSSLSGLELILNRLESDIKIGSPPRMYEVYATLQNSKSAMLKELRELQKMLMEQKRKLFVPQETTETVNNNVFVTSTDMLDMIKKAKEESYMNEIKAEFDISDSSDKMRDKLENG